MTIMPAFLVHGYVLVEGDKMSKSLGNIRDPKTFADTFGVEALVIISCATASLVRTWISPTSE